MTRLICSIVLIFGLIINGCTTFSGSAPGIGEFEAESKANIKIYTDVDVKIKPNGSVLIDDTTIFYINSDLTYLDMTVVEDIFDKRYQVYKALKGCPEK